MDISDLTNQETALSSPLTTTKIFFARMIVPIPMLYACFGTSSADSKNRLLASIVLSFKSTQCVGSTKLSPGSLKDTICGQISPKVPGTI